MSHNSIDSQPPSKIPATYGVTQAGQHNTNIANVENMHLTVLAAPQPTPAPPIIPIDFSLHASYYHLFVVRGEKYSASPFSIVPTRALTKYTADDIQQRYKYLQPDILSELMSFPALFMDENASVGKALPGQKAFVGCITEICVHDTGIQINFELMFSIHQQVLNENASHFGIETHGRSNELNQTHWALKRINLLEAFHKVNIDPSISQLSRTFTHE